jgi:lysozyme
MQTYLQLQETFTKKAENCVLVGYVHGDNTPTWGWGHTGPEVKVGQSITPAQAETYFQIDQAKADKELRERCTPTAFAKLSEHEKAALLDFVFNVGANPSWNIWKVANGTVPGSVPDELDRFIWVHPNGPNKPAVTNAGLQNRRAAEKTLWNTADVNTAVVVANAGGQTISSATRELVTPPTPNAPKSLAKTSLGLKIGGLFAGSSGLAAKVFTPDTQAKAQNAADTAAAHAASFGHFGPAIASVCGASVVVIAAGALLVHVFQQETSKV